LHGDPAVFMLEIIDYDISSMLEHQQWRDSQRPADECAVLEGTIVAADSQVFCFVIHQN
jgi:hypothetical protein